jgi:hypothetical protein
MSDDLIPYIAYPGDAPPELCEFPPDYDFRGHTWSYFRASPDEAKQAMETHRQNWPEHTPDPRLVEMAGGKRIVDAVWDGDQYHVDPSTQDVDCGVGDGHGGWLSLDGHVWTQNGGGKPLGNFDSVSIRLVGGPRDGEIV